MRTKLFTLLIAGTLLLIGCSDYGSTDKYNVETGKLTYSNIIDQDTQNEVRDLLKDNKVSNEQADYFIKIVKDYNKKSKLETMNTSHDRFTSIDTLQVPYDEVKLAEIWDYTKLGYMDFNCRLTSFVLYKNFIDTDENFKYDDYNLMFDLDTIENNPISNFTKDEIIKFQALYSSIQVENTQDVNSISKMIVKEWEDRKIKFEENKDITMINVFLHSPEDSIVFVGHSGISIKTDSGILFIEKYGPSLPYQVSKFKGKEQLRSYLMDRLDVDTSNNGASKPIIMENYELIN